MNVESRATRILKNLANYRDITNKPNIIPHHAPDINFQDEELTIGIYENFPLKADEYIVITNLGLYILYDRSWKYIGYNEINYISAPSDKKEGNRIEAKLYNDQIIQIPVRGNKGKFKDVFEFSRFLDRVVQDVQRENIAE